MSTRVGEHTLQNGKEDFSLVIKAYNTMGEEVSLTQNLGGKLIVIRL
jgi:hypothetical protein